MSTAAKDSANTPEQQSFAAVWCAARGISPDTGTLEPSPFGTSGFMFVNYDDKGKPRRDLSTKRYDRDENKYMSPIGKGSVIYAPRSDSWKTWEKSDEVWLAEGEGKTLALVQLGLPTLGVRGCRAWHLKGSQDLHPELAKRIQPGKQINLVFDADWKSNPDVHRGLYDCMTAIRALGGIPYAVNVPNIPGRDDTGIDDLIAMWRDTGVDDKSVLASFKQLERLKEIDNPYIVNFKEPYPTAQNFVESVYDDDCLIHWQGDFYKWVGVGWQRYSLELIRQAIYEFIEAAGKASKLYHVNAILDALRSVSQQAISRAPCWLDDTELDPDSLLACSNGLLDLSTGELHPHSPEYFNLSWGDVEYDPDAKCPKWLEFLTQIYPDDPSAAKCLQEYIGYCLTTDTSQQKAIMLIGPRRSGKGTVVKVVQALLGPDSYCAPTLQSVGQQFGLQTWIGKRAAFVSDARVSVRNNSQSMVEKVLTITGEDAQYVDRKHKEPWEGRLPVRLWVLSNQLPATRDTGAALVSRFLLLEHPESFYGRENTGLEGTLNAELSGILNWALVGLARLRKRGHFVQPKSGDEELRRWEILNSPMLGFITDRCVLEPSRWVVKSDLRAEYRAWCIENSINDTTNDSHFTNDLVSASGFRVKMKQKRVKNKRQRVFDGIGVDAAKAGTGGTGKY